MRLTDDELRDVLVRADEIQRFSRSGRAADHEVRAVINAAEEAGLERAAVERALRERFDVLLEPPVVGALVFAESADGKYHVAEVLSTSPESAQIRYLSGGEHTLCLDQIRPCTFRPGERVTVYWPWWGPWTCTVISYDAAAQRVKLTDGWGTNKTFKVEDVWLEPSRRETPEAGSRTRIYVTLIGVGSGIGALIGSALTWLLVR